MSDLEVRSALDTMEQMLQSGALEPENFAAWQQRFSDAMATAERGAGWPETAARAHDLSRRLDAAAEILSAQQDELRRKGDLHAQGARALKGYRPS